jgi:hypothetical protein
MAPILFRKETGTGKGERVRQERTALAGNGSGTANPARSKAE